ncbi:unnamed protein product [Peronospora belbahrii]|uniref:Uncharacterized protein n=1 Tax=Peronospora belbahrii TaxID=622444 RepID=A0ABN8CUH6_9STRA|nr:unnamed protein product [Peronospora belbahrii]
MRPAHCRFMEMKSCTCCRIWCIEFVPVVKGEAGKKNTLRSHHLLCIRADGSLFMVLTSHDHVVALQVNILAGSRREYSSVNTLQHDIRSPIQIYRKKFDESSILTYSR